MLNASLAAGLTRRLGSHGLIAATATLLALSATTAHADVAIEFEDVSEQAGLAEPLAQWELGHGAAWGDVTGNDRPDLYLGAFADRQVYGQPDAPLPNMLFLNEPAGFTLAPHENIRFDGDRARTSMALFVDLTNNGKLDLLVGMHGKEQESQLFENRWPDGFRLVTPDADAWPADLHMRNATPIDLDHDGLLDLLLIDGRYDGEAQRVVALRNRGDFQFEDVSAAYGFPESHTRGLGTAVGDVNNDGRLDLFVADRNRLFISQDDGRYVEHRPGFYEVPNLPRDNWPCGAAFADLTGNGLLDLVFTVHGQPGMIFVYVNRGIDDDGMPQLEDVTDATGLESLFPRTGTTGMDIRGAQLALVDLDHDGRRDILMGMVHENEAGQIQPLVFRNTGAADGVPRFEAPPLESIIGYYATAPVSDYDRDGRLDIFMATWFHELDSHLFRNVTEGGNFLVVRVESQADDLNPMGVGATVRLYEAGHAGDDEHLLGRGDIALANGYSVGDEAMAHFGLGEVEQCDVVVTWQGREVTHADVAVNQYLTVPVGGDTSEPAEDE